MSNIQDITSLSDLLTTSPNQPNENNEKSLRLHGATIEKAKDLTDFGDQQIPKDESSITSDNEGDRRIGQESLNPLDQPTLDSTMETLLAKQSVKLDLNTKRNDLLRKRTTLQTQVDDLRIKQKHLNDKRQQILAKQKLDQLLQENDNEIRPQTSLSSNDDDSILKQLHVLPSTDWNLRLVLIRRFFTRIEIDKISTSNHYSHTLVRSIEFRIIARMLFRIPIRLLIDTKDDSLMEIVVNDNVPSPLITTLNMISPSFTQVLTNKYLPRRKVNLIFCGLSSLANLVHTRIAILYRLINKYPKYVTGIDLKVLEKEELNDMFAILKTVDTLNFHFQEHSVRLQWIIKLTDMVTAECESYLELSITDNTAYVLPNINSLFLSLVKQNGVQHAFQSIIKTTYNIDAI